MSEAMNGEPQVAFSKFVQELQKEYNFHTNGGTSYRRVTADLSLRVANQVGEFVPFLNREMAKQTVSKLFPSLDQDRTNDIAKMMNVIARELNRNVNLPEEVRQYLQQKRLNRKPLSFVKK